MLTYTIRPGSIASVQYVEGSDGSLRSAIFYSHEGGVYWSLEKPWVEGQPMLPRVVKDRVALNFSIMFNAPVELRQALIDATKPEIITVDEAS